MEGIVSNQNAQRKAWTARQRKPKAKALLTFSFKAEGIARRISVWLEARVDIVVAVDGEREDGHGERKSLSRRRSWE